MKRALSIRIMMAVLAFTFLIPLSAGKTWGVDIGDPAPHQVFLYEHTNYQGHNMSFSPDYEVKDLTKWKFSGSNTNWNDKISSIKLGKNVKIYLYKDINFGNLMTVLQGDCKNNKLYPTLHSYGWGDKISSFRVRYADCWY